MPPSVHAELLPESPVSPNLYDQEGQQHQEPQKDEDLKSRLPAWRRCFDSLHGWVLQPQTPYQHACFWTGFAVTIATGALLFLWGELLVNIKHTDNVFFTMFSLTAAVSDQGSDASYKDLRGQAPSR